MFIEAVEQILAAHCRPEDVRAIEAGAPTAALWGAFEQGGFLELLSPESAGGAGLPMGELLPIALALGAAAAPLPVLATVLSRRLLQPLGLRPPAGPIALAGAVRREGHALVIEQLPGGLHAAFVLANDGGTLRLLEGASAEREGSGVHGSARATLRWAQVPAGNGIEGAGAALPFAAAACHAALLAGAMQRCLTLTLDYASQRQQFGKPIGRFQAVQHQIAVMAEQVVAVKLAAALALADSTPWPEPRRAALAKARCSEAAARVAAAAHAVHGAIGITAEYDLQLFTRRLHEWRMADGSEACWNAWLGQRLLEGEASVAELVRELSG